MSITLTNTVDIDYKKTPKTGSHPKRNLQILPTPHLHTLVISTDFLKKLSADGEQPTSHCWTSVDDITKEYFVKNGYFQFFLSLSEFGL